MRGFTQAQQESYAEHQLDQANKGKSGIGFKKASTSSSSSSTMPHGKHTILNPVSSQTFRVYPSKQQQQEKLKKLYPAIYDFLVYCELDNVAKVFAKDTQMVSLFF